MADPTHDQNAPPAPPGAPGVAYGAARHYLGTDGETYFQYQNQGGDTHGQIEAHKFQPYIKETDTLVDFGCGAGNLLRSLRCGKRFGVEINPAARRVCTESGIPCHADLAELPDGCADVIISNHCLEHVPNPVAAMALMGKKLKPTGTLAICVPIDDWRVGRHYDPAEPNHHLYTWSCQLMGNCLDEAGFAVRREDVRMLTHAWPRWHLQLYRALPLPVFDATCWAWSVLRRRRQVLAVVKPK